MHDAVLELRDSQAFRTEMANGRKLAAQHVVAASKRARGFDCQQVRRLLHHADGRAVTRGVRAESARILGTNRERATPRAARNLRTRLAQREDKRIEEAFRFAQERKRRPSCAAATESWQARKRAD